MILDWKTSTLDRQTRYGSLNDQAFACVFWVGGDRPEGRWKLDTRQTTTRTKLRREFYETREDAERAADAFVVRWFRKINAEIDRRDVTKS